MDKENWPDYEDGDRQPWLREVPEYKDLLIKFTKEVLLDNEFRRGAHLKLLSEYMDHTLEAFLVLVYVNHHDYWKMEFEARSTNNRLSDSSDDSQGNDNLSAISDVSSSVGSGGGGGGSRFTNRGGARGRGKGKFGGWSNDGIDLYNKIADIIYEQRQERSEPVLRDFERELMRSWAVLKRGGVTTDSRPVKRARNSVSSALENATRRFPRVSTSSASSTSITGV